MDKRYQVFISSTFIDLEDERRKVYQSILEMDCIPAGMELFPALDEEQFNFIKKIIDDSDYYILIIGGRYGSISPTGISYTEMEYDYAVSRGIKVIALLHGAPENIPAGKTEKSDDGAEKLKKFREKVATGRLVREWKTADQLPGLVTTSLNRTMKTYPATGWVRGNVVDTIALLSQINELRLENDRLRDEVINSSKIRIGRNISEFNENKIYRIAYNFGSGTKYSVELSLVDIFSAIGPTIFSKRDADKVKLTMESYISRITGGDENFLIIDQFDMSNIGLALYSSGLVEFYDNDIDKGGPVIWKITAHGMDTLMNIIGRRS
ncbi:DUF4062 domain-containing protein [Azospirillum doebereinerae]